MNKKNVFTLLCVKNRVRQCFLTAGWMFLMCLTGILPVSASAFAQQEKLTFHSNELTVKEVLDVITAQLQYDVFYNTELLNIARKVKFLMTNFIANLVKKKKKIRLQYWLNLKNN